MTRSLGIDIGTATIRVAEIETIGRKRRLIGLYEVARNADSSPGAQLKAFFEESRLTAERISMGTDSHLLILRNFEFPFNSLKRAEAAISAEFEDTLPLDMESLLLEVRPTGKNGKLHRFLGGVLPKASLASLDAIADESGVVVNSYFSDLEALGQLALNQNLPASTMDHPYAVCDFGYASTKIAFLKGGRPRFLNKKAKELIAPQIIDTRLIRRGASELTEWIRSKNVLSEDEARQWLIHRAEIRTGEEDGRGAGDISDEIKRALRPLMVELYQTFQAHRSSEGGGPTAMYITGGLSGLKGFREFLTEELHINVHPWPVFEGFDTHTLPLTIEKERSFGAAIAVAHRWSYAATDGWLNFKRMTAQKKLLSSFLSSLTRPDLKPVLTGLGLGLAGVLIYTIVGSTLLGQQAARVSTDLQGEFRKLDKDMAKRAAKVVDDPVKSRQMFREEKKKRLANEAAKGGQGPRAKARTEVLLDISELMPSGSTLKRLDVLEAPQAQLDVESWFEMKGDTSAEALKKTVATLSGPFAERGYAQVSLETSPNLKNTVVLKTHWKGGPQ